MWVVVFVVFSYCDVNDFLNVMLQSSYLVVLVVSNLNFVGVQFIFCGVGGFHSDLLWLSCFVVLVRFMASGNDGVPKLWA